MSAVITIDSTTNTVSTTAQGCAGTKTDDWQVIVKTTMELVEAIMFDQPGQDIVIEHIG